MKFLGFLTLLVIILADYWFWSHFHPPIAKNIRQTLFEGITYIREVRQTPRPIIIHFISVDLTKPNIRFLVTPGEVRDDGEIGARTTSQFLTEFKLQLAINGNFFYPFHPLFSVDFWNAYPKKRGDPVYVVGLASSHGQVYSQTKKSFETLYISADNQARFQTSIGPLYHAISGRELFIKQGKIQGPFPKGAFNEKPYPRTALALDKTAKTLMIFVVDGKLKNYSEGVTLMELADIVQSYGADMALNLDGGGSSTLVMEGPSKKMVLLNMPIHGRIQGKERLIGNHLGIYTNLRSMRSSP
ncbi:conserved hypothetical protein [Beggiatoa sp. PS]|nr:conserved hypothetical protein [Beggiatoa sp. PS]